ncbi:MAG: hypothetical protein R6V45_11110 [Oceanipulchritudo sp.]
MSASESIGRDWYWDADGHLVIEDPSLGGTWWNYLFNDSAQLKIDPFGQGASWSREPRIQQWGRGRRELWLRFPDGRCWCPSGWPHRERSASWRCIHAPVWTRIEGRLGDIEVHWRVFIPRQGQREVWTVEVRHHGRKPIEVTLTHVLFQPLAGCMGSVGYWDAEKQLLLRHDFPHHAAYEDYERLKQLANYLYLRPLDTPDRWAASDRDYLGSAPPGEVPEGISGELPGIPAALDPSCAVVQYDLSMDPDERRALHFIAGAAVSPEAAALACGDLENEAALRTEFASLESAWLKTESTLQIETPDPEINRYVNRWAKKEILWMARLWRNGISTPWRNELQDSMGYSLFDFWAARPFLDTVTSAQNRDGYLKVWNTRPGERPNHPLVDFHHNDGGIWLIICQCLATHQSGDIQVLKREIPWSDGGAAPLLDHLAAALEHTAADRGDHGLVRMRDGDWTDPLNGPGRKGHGGSGWATLALAYACRRLGPLAAEAGRESLAERCTRLHAELTEAAQQQLWTGDRFAYGIDDDGNRFGDRDDDRVWLNTQSWAILANVATPEQIPLVRRIVETRLMTPLGPLLFDPPFRQWCPQVGRLSLKVPGSSENGAVYCHAAAFWAAALAHCGDLSAALDVLRRILPGHPENPCSQSGQPPIWQHNFWFSEPGSPRFGRTSGVLGTGTVAWALFTIVEQIIGVRATVKGLETRGNLPPEWGQVRITRRFRDGRQHVKRRQD